MKKLFSFLAIALLITGFIATSVVYASSSKKLVLVNTDGSDKLATAIATVKNVDGRPYITPGKQRVIQLTISPIDPHYEGIVGIYDASSVGNASVKTVEGEIEMGTDNKSKTLDYERSLDISNGVVIIQGAKTAVLLEWENVIP